MSEHPAPTPKLAYTIEEAIFAIGLPRTTIFEDIGTGLLPARKRGRRTLILADVLKGYLLALPEVKPPASD